MTVTEVLLNFREGLRAIAPIAERVGIPWKRPDEYDEWDSIATALFDSLVVDVLSWLLPEPVRAELSLPSYDLKLHSYADLSTIEVTHPDLVRGRWILHAFGTVDRPFDTLEVRLVSDDGDVLREKLEICVVENAKFSLRLVQEDSFKMVE